MLVTALKKIYKLHILIPDHHYIFRLCSMMEERKKYKLKVKS